MYKMVYMSGGKNARNQASIVNRPTCGGNKKAGLAPSSGYWFNQHNPINRGSVLTMPLYCVPNTTIQTQKTGYRATIGGNMG
jgi:hypothetical protein